MEVTHFIILICLGLVLTSQAQDCSQPKPGANMVLKDSDIVLNTFPSGSQATFVCSVGYTRVGGSGVVMCNAGIWSTVTLKCQIKSCGSAGEVENGDIDYPTGNEFGDKLVVTCNRGFRMLGRSEIICGDQGWMDRLPVCEVVTCEPPSQISDGSFSPVKDVYNYRDVVTYKCTGELTLTGSKTLTCSEDGTFMLDPPKCIQVECAEPKIDYAEWISGSRPPHKYLSTVTYRCNLGYEMEGDATLVCGISSQWSPGIPKCKAVTCSPPPPIVYGTFRPQKGSYQYPEVVEYSCQQGFTLTGSKSLLCSLDGTFKGAPPTCHEVECAEPKIDHAEWVSGSRPPHKYLSTVTYRCNLGYEMEGDATLLCGISSQWSPGIPKCTAVTCSPPPPIVNGAFRPQKGSYQYPEVVEYSCQQGFTLTGSASLSCSPGGTFKGAPPTCHDSGTSTSIGTILGWVFGILFALLIVGIVGFLVYKKICGRKVHKPRPKPEEEVVF